MRTLVVAFGNRDRGDDGVGPAVVELLDDVATIIVSGDPLEVIDRWRNFERVVIVDAMRSGQDPGRIAWSLVGDTEAVRPRYASTHGWGPVELIEIARALNKLADHVEIVGIEAASTAVGRGLSQPVRAAALAVAAELHDA